MGLLAVSLLAEASTRLTARPSLGGNLEGLLASFQNSGALT